LRLPHTENTIKYRLLGNTSLYVSALCLGTMTFARNGVWLNGLIGSYGSLFTDSLGVNASFLNRDLFQVVAIGVKRKQEIKLFESPRNGGRITQNRR
jgi:hypothetical protein